MGVTRRRLNGRYRHGVSDAPTADPGSKEISEPQRLRIDLAYDGTDFVGWAAQPGLRSVQGEVERALRQVAGLPETAQVVCAGRTDSGVHARGQVIHVDLSRQLDLHRLRRGLNAVLPEDISINRVAIAPPGFDARFSALARRYEYLVSQADRIEDPLQRRSVLAYGRDLDIELLNKTGEIVVGLHDFAGFCRRREGATTIRQVQQANWQNRDNLVALHIQADAFCHSMVRSLVGAMLMVGDGRRDIAWFTGLLASNERQSSIPVAAPHGLSLQEVLYPPAAQLSDRATATRARRSHGDHLSR